MGVWALTLHVARSTREQKSRISDYRAKSAELASFYRILYKCSTGEQKAKMSSAAAALRSSIQASVLEKLGPRFDADFGFRAKSKQELLPGGIPRGAFTEIHGPASSGRTTLMFGALAHLTRQPEFCAYVDAADSFDPVSAAESGVHLPHLLWVRCSGSSEHALKAADLLLQGGGFGMLVLDLTGVSLRDARRISLASWFRLRNAIEKTPTAFVVAEEQLNAASCSAKQILCHAANPVSRPELL